MGSKLVVEGTGASGRVGRGDERWGEDMGGRGGDTGGTAGVESIVAGGEEGGGRPPPPICFFREGAAEEIYTPPRIDAFPPELRRRYIHPPYI